MTIQMQQEFTLFADYFQFYAHDSRQESFIPEWTQEDVSFRARFQDASVAIGTVRNMMVSAIVQIHDKRPVFDLDEYDHVIEGSVSVPSGRIQVRDIMMVESFFYDVTPGDYRLIVMFEGLDSLSDNGLEGDDKYTLVFYPAKKAAPEALKLKPVQ